MSDAIIDGVPEPRGDDSLQVEAAPVLGDGRVLAAQPAEATMHMAHVAVAAVADVSATTDPHDDHGSPGAGYHAPTEPPAGSVHEAAQDDPADEAAEADQAAEAAAAESAAAPDPPAENASAGHAATDDHADAADSHGA